MKEDYQRRIKAADPSDRNRIAEQAHNALVKAVTDRGLSVEMLWGGGEDYCIHRR